MGSKGSQTTQSYNTSQYAPAGAGYIDAALANASGLAAQGVPTLPTAPVAGLTDAQQQSFQAINNLQGGYQPYLNQAADIFRQGPNVSQFFNPFANAVTSQLQNVFGQQQAQNNANLVQAAGGVGADRIAVGQGNLANQQALAAGQTLAGLYQPSLSAALQEQGQQASGLAGLGQLSQQLGLQGAQAQYGAGLAQQQQQQAVLNAPYQQQLAQIALPYQLGQWYSGQVGALAPSLGGTTYGQGQTTSQYNPSIFSQIASAGLLGGGLFGGRGGLLGKGSGGAIPYARGGGVFANPFADGGVAPIDISGGLFGGKKLLHLPDQSLPTAATHVPALMSAPQQPNMQQQSQQDMLGLLGLGKSLARLRGPSWGGGSLWGGDAWGGDAANPLPGLTAGDYGARGGVFARGGVTNPFALLPHFDDGGGAGGDGDGGGEGGAGGAGEGASGDDGSGGAVGSQSGPGVADAAAAVAGLGNDVGDFGAEADMAANQAMTNQQALGLDFGQVGGNLGMAPGQANNTPGTASMTNTDMSAPSLAMQSVTQGDVSPGNFGLNPNDPGPTGPTVTNTANESMSPTVGIGPNTAGIAGFGPGSITGAEGESADISYSPSMSTPAVDTPSMSPSMSPAPAMSAMSPAMSTSTPGSPASMGQPGSDGAALLMQLAQLAGSPYGPIPTGYFPQQTVRNFRGGGAVNPFAMRRYDDGGDVTFDDRFTDTGLPVYRDVPPAAMDAWRSGVDDDVRSGQTAQGSDDAQQDATPLAYTNDTASNPYAALAKPAGGPGSPDAQAVSLANPFAAPVNPALGYAAAATPPPDKEGFFSKLLSDPKRMTLILAGLSALTPQGAAAGFAQGMQLVQHQQSADLQAKKLEQEANQHLQDLGLKQQALAIKKKEQEDTASEKEDIVKNIVDAMASGDQAPSLTGLYGKSAAVRAEAARRGLPLAKWQMEYSAAQRQIASLNGPQMQRFIGLSNSVTNTIDEVKALSEQMHNSGIPIINRAKLAAILNTDANSERGQLAQRYLTSINTLKSEFANLEAGGFAPHESVWQLANQQVSGDFGEKQLGAALDEVSRLVKYRLNAIPNINTLGPGAPNRYTGQTGQPAAPAAPTFTGRTATGPGGKKLRETSDGQWVP